MVSVDLLKALLAGLEILKYGWIGLNIFVEI